ncbi:MAG: L-threonylcarbamoyladenylate synthase [Terriglobales bacterium]
MPQTSPTPAEMNKAATLLYAGHLVAFPTETVYGLGANALDPIAVAKIYAVKRRPPTSPLIVHVASIDMAKSLVATWPEAAARLTKKFWPGPLTLVLPIKTDGETDGAPVEPKLHLFNYPRDPNRRWWSKPPRIPLIVTAGLPTVALRMPDHPVALALLREVGIPLAAPSANRFTELSPTTAEHVRRSLGNDVAFILDGGPCEVGIESTVLSLAEPQPLLLRPGIIPRALLEHFIGPIVTTDEVPTDAHPAPGMHPRHYSPRTPLFLVSNGELPTAGRGIYLQHTRPPNRAGVEVVQMPLPARDYAARLYVALHEADDAQVDWIAVDAPPEAAEWEAVHDRLRRAAFRK